MRLEANPALTAALAIAVISAATLAGAWFFQLVLDIRPCPLCLEQRYAYYLAIPLGALVAFAAAKDAPRGVLLAGLAILAPPHSAMPGSGPITPASNGSSGRGRPIAPARWSISAAPATCWSGSRPTKVIRCDEVQWRFLGLSLAGYNVLISLAMAAIAGWGIFRLQRR